MLEGRVLVKTLNDSADVDNPSVVLLVFVSMWLWAPNEGAVVIWFFSKCWRSMAKTANETNQANNSLVLLLFASF